MPVDPLGDLVFQGQRQLEVRLGAQFVVEEPLVESVELIDQAEKLLELPQFLGVPAAVLRLSDPIQEVDPGAL